MSDAPEAAGGERARPSLEAELATVINRHSAENGSDTPDFILGQYLLGCLALFDATVRRRETWYGRGCGDGAAISPPVALESDPQGVAPAAPAARVP